MISGFLCACHGILRLSDEQSSEHPGVAADCTKKNIRSSFQNSPVVTCSTQVSLPLIRNFARKSLIYIDAYREKGGQRLTTKKVEYAVRKYRRHRTVVYRNQ